VGTNNGLESTNAVVKKESTLRKRLALALFLRAASDLVNNWSKERDPEHLNYRKPIAIEVTLGTTEYRSAYQWLKKPTRITIQAENLFYSRAGHSTIQSLSAADVKAYKVAVEKLQFKNFDEYDNLINGIWCTTLSRDNFRNSTCTCPSYFKDYICKHIIGCAALEKLIKIPSVAKSVEIGQKPKRGRPKLAKKALQRQEPSQPVSPPPVLQPATASPVLQPATAPGVIQPVTAPALVTSVTVLAVVKPATAPDVDQPAPAAARLLDSKKRTASAVPLEARLPIKRACKRVE